MDISNISISPPASNPAVATGGNTTATAVEGRQPSANQQPSANVTLSVQGQKLSQTNPSQTNQSQPSQTQTLNNVNTPVTPNAVPQSKETNAAPGIRFMAGESKGGRVNTYA